MKKIVFPALIVCCFFIVLIPLGILEDQCISKQELTPSLWIQTPRSKLAVEVIGKGKQTVIFVHGLGLSRNTWRKVTTILAKQGIRSVIWDLAGHGESLRLIDNVTIEGHARDLLEVANYFNMDDITVIGHSCGGIIAQQALSLDSGRIKRMGLISSWFGKMPEERVKTLRQRYHIAMLVSPFLRLIPATIFPNYIGDFVRSPNLKDGKDFKACVESAATISPRIIKRVSFLHGKKDYSIPSELGKDAANILHGGYVEIDTYAHQLPETHSAETAMFVLENVLIKGQ